MTSYCVTLWKCTLASIGLDAWYLSVMQCEKLVFFLERSLALSLHLFFFRSFPSCFHTNTSKLTLSLSFFFSIFLSEVFFLPIFARTCSLQYRTYPFWYVITWWRSISMHKKVENSVIVAIMKFHYAFHVHAREKARNHFSSKCYSSDQHIATLSHDIGLHVWRWISPFSGVADWKCMNPSETDSKVIHTLKPEEGLW